MSDFKLENTTVWSFPERGNWATHNPKYRGNFAPQIAKNIILKYSKEGDIILDPMVGGGTTLIEAKILNRKGIGRDINDFSIKTTLNSLSFEGNYKYESVIEKGDTRDLKGISDNSIDLILTHPPYLDIIKYSNGVIQEDLSNISDVKFFCDEFEKAIIEYQRVLKENKYCVILIGDIRQNSHYVPLSFYLMERFLKNNFILKEDIIKLQHNCQSDSYWDNGKNYNFMLIKHEHLFVFRKPKSDENLSKFKNSIFI